jgi:hypothetical protein
MGSLSGVRKEGKMTKGYWKVEFEHAPGGFIGLSAKTVMTSDGFGTEAHVYPVTIVQARYGGSYEGGLGAAAWLAFPVSPHRLQDEPWAEWNGSDIPCAEFWGTVNAESWPVGRGVSPSAAHDDLLDQVCRLAGVDRAVLDRAPTWDREEMATHPGRRVVSDTGD